jgi:hypothetical protein
VTKFAKIEKIKFPKVTKIAKIHENRENKIPKSDKNRENSRNRENKIPKSRKLAPTKQRFENQLAQLREDLLLDAEHHTNTTDIDALLRVAAAERGSDEHNTASSFKSLADDAKNVLVDGEQSDGELSEVIIADIDAAEEYDDETTTTASGNYDLCDNFDIVDLQIC